MSDLSEEFAADLARMMLEVFCPALADRANEINFVLFGRWGPHEAHYRLMSHLDEQKRGWITVGDVRRAAMEAWRG